MKLDVNLPKKKVSAKFRCLVYNLLVLVANPILPQATHMKRGESFCNICLILSSLYSSNLPTVECNLSGILEFQGFLLGLFMKTSSRNYVSGVISQMAV